jgi:hypothetical protein
MVAIRRRRANNPGAASTARTIRVAFGLLLLVCLVVAGRLLQTVMQQDGSKTVSDSPPSTATAAETETTKGQSHPHHVALSDGDHDKTAILPHQDTEARLPLPKLDLDQGIVDQGIVDQGIGNKSNLRPKLPPVETIPTSKDKTPDQHLATEDPHHLDVHVMPDMVEETEPPVASTAQGVQNAGNSISGEAALLIRDKTGSGATKLGYVKDLLYERAHPPVHAQSSPVASDDSAKVSELAGASLKACDQWNGDHWDLSPLCRDSDTLLYAYNSASYARTLCGVEVAAGAVVKLDSLVDHTCVLSKEPAEHLLPQNEMPLDGKGMPPIQVLSKQHAAATAHLQEVTNCEIPCEYEVDLLMEDPPRERFISGEEWALLYDPPSKIQALEKMDFRQETYYSTFSSTSSIPVSTFSFDKYNLRKAPALDWESTGNAASYLVDSMCNGGTSRRAKWMSAVTAAGLPVHAYGPCQHNTDLAAGESMKTMEDRVALLQKNRIALAFETTTEKDAFSHLTWEALQSGAVPAMVGPSNAGLVLPPNSFFSSGTYNNWDSFAVDLKALAENKTHWQSLHAWRSDEVALTAFEERMNFTRVSPECRTCRWAYAKKYGLKWDHSQQQIRESSFSRKLCLTEEAPARVQKPFRESWAGAATHSTGAEESYKCGPMTSEATIETEHYKVTRKVMQHDQITDILVSQVEASDSTEKVILRLEFDVTNFEGAYFPQSHSLVPSQKASRVSSASIQDMHSRVTILADWTTSIYSPKEGVMEVVLPASSDEDITRRIRVIMEDVETLHYKLTEFFPFSFGKMMVKDFLDPVELYYPHSR